MHGMCVDGEYKTNFHLPGSSPVRKLETEQSLQNIPSVESPSESKGREDGLGTLEAQHRSEAEVCGILQEAPNIIDWTLNQVLESLTMWLCPWEVSHGAYPSDRQQIEHIKILKSSESLRLNEIFIEGGGRHQGESVCKHNR
ncbi:hypothetical protein EMCG_00506 [[Emmonsia] crescens]|uniref:Uncharacterized protein n=1 Tax=[Emmonsia] crescens TaxID=73230 RepID=A0A0G2IZV6_9EURO|nr:hypothetical protein EMCG_00506 [Emmonsia crescens UAMH 3008]